MVNSMFTPTWGDPGNGPRSHLVDLVLPGIGAIARRAAADGARGGAHGGANGQVGTAWPMGFKQGKKATNIVTPRLQD